MKVEERFINYVKIHTASSEDTDLTPTTDIQFDLARFIASEMQSIGMSDIFVDEHSYVYGFIPATPGFEDKSAIGFIAHLDTIPDFSGDNVKPSFIPDYNGTELQLGSSGRVLSPDDFPHLKDLIGDTLIITDGTTVLGADDKAGIAEIMTACEEIISKDIPHCAISVCFTPDEEVGHGASLLDLDKFAAEFAFTVDGGLPSEISYETFNAAAAHWDISGINVHPGDAKDKMVNASLVAIEINSMLPECDIPSKTSGYEGFYHLTEMSGNIEKAQLSYIIRDHDSSLFEARKALMKRIESFINEKYGAGTARLTVRNQYFNMIKVLKDKMEIIELAKEAVVKSGLKPVISPVRGGTDGSQLSYRGLPCPNLGTGGFCFHGPYEHITVENLNKVTEIIINIIKIHTN